MLVTFWGLSIIAQLGMSIFEVKFLLAFHTIFFFFFFSRFDVVVFQNVYHGVEEFPVRQKK